MLNAKIANSLVTNHNETTWPNFKKIFKHISYCLSRDQKQEIISPQKASSKSSHINQTRALCYVLLTHQANVGFLIRAWSDERLKHTHTLPSIPHLSAPKSLCTPGINPHRPVLLILFLTSKRPHFGIARWPRVHKEGRKQILICTLTMSYYPSSGSWFS